MIVAAELTTQEVLDVGILGETLTYRIYDSLARRVQIVRLQTRLIELKKDAREHLETLRAHRKALFLDAVITVSEEEAKQVFGTVDPNEIRDKDSLIQVLYATIRVEEYGTHFYEKTRFRVLDPYTQRFMRVLAEEGKTHARILKQQIDVLRGVQIEINEEGRVFEVF